VIEDRAGGKVPKKMVLLIEIISILKVFRPFVNLAFITVKE